MADPADVVSVERVIHAPPEKIFALLADAGRHNEFDGSGTVKGLSKPSQPLQLGSTFDMKMKMGIPYTMRNTIVEFEPNKKIAWQPRPKLMKSLGGRIWRYELEPADGGTRVRESWDISQERGMKSLVRKGGEHTAKNMEKTLERIEQIVAS
jgi:uncharacterized protein YndB with AHSA1/START domain